jgi:hypothetical protein
MAVPWLHSSISTYPRDNPVIEDYFPTSHTGATESIVGKEIARVAGANIRAICISAVMLTEMQSF